MVSINANLIKRDILSLVLVANILVVRHIVTISIPLKE